MPGAKKRLHQLLVIICCFQLSYCKFKDNPSLDDSTKSFIKDLKAHIEGKKETNHPHINESKHIKRWKKGHRSEKDRNRQDELSRYDHLGQDQLKWILNETQKVVNFENRPSIRRELIEMINNFPTSLENYGETPSQLNSFIVGNREKLTDWLEDYSAKLKQIRIHITNLRKFEFEKAGVDLEVSPEERAVAQAAIFYMIMYWKSFNDVALNLMLPTILEIHHIEYSSQSSFDNWPEIVTFRDYWVKKMVEFKGTSEYLIINMEKVAANIEALAIKNPTGAIKRGRAPDFVVAHVGGTIAKVRDNQIHWQQAESGEKAQDLAAQMPEEKRQQYAQMIDDYREKLNEVPLLWEPGHGDTWKDDVLIWVGNLTWGLIQTLVGVGIWISFWIASGFSDKINRPTWSLNSSGQLLTCHINCGLSDEPKKYTLGLIQINSMNDDPYDKGSKEVGYSKLSAMFGPLYLPALVTSWATTVWTKQDGYMSRLADRYMYIDDNAYYK